MATDTTVYPKWLDRKEYPFQSHYFTQPMGRQHFVDEGGQGDPIVMIHGNPVWSFSYRNVIKAMSPTNRCIAPDHIGFGLSDKPYSWDYLPEHHAENLDRLLESLNLNNITLIVDNWGGPIGLSYALKHPEKIKRLLILNTWMWSVKDNKDFVQFSNMMGGAVGRFMIKNFNLFGRFVAKQAIGKHPAFTPAIHKHYYAHMATPQDRKGSYVFPKQIIGSSDWLASLWEQRERINHKPTTFIWGLEDFAFGEDVLDIFVKNWHNPKVIKLADAGHYPQELRYDAVIDELKSY